jgi:hypothetical protein
MPPMFPIVLDAVIGALAGALGFLVVSRVPRLKANPRAQRIISVVVIVLGFQLASQLKALKFTEALTRTLRALEARDPEGCYSYLYPRAGKATVIGKNDGRDELMASMRDVVLSSRRSPAAIDENAANVHLQTVLAALKKGTARNCPRFKSLMIPRPIMPQSAEQRSLSTRRF